MGPERVIWRYDPILFSNVTDPEFHAKTYRTIAERLQGYTFRSVISIVHLYGKVRKRLRALSENGIEVTSDPGKGFGDLMRALVHSANSNGMDVVGCAPEIDLVPYGIRPGKCVDDDLISRIAGLRPAPRKDPSQRKACRCVVSKDIGMYNSCLFGCRYCYATTSFERAKTNHRIHDPGSPSLRDRVDGRPATRLDHEKNLSLQDQK